jgi:hypothetical protein
MYVYMVLYVCMIYVVPTSSIQHTYITKCMSFRCQNPRRAASATPAASVTNTTHAMDCCCALDAISPFKGSLPWLRNASRCFATWPYLPPVHTNYKSVALASNSPRTAVYMRTTFDQIVLVCCQLRQPIRQSVQLLFSARKAWLHNTSRQD